MWIKTNSHSTLFNHKRKRIIFGWGIKEEWCVVLNMKPLANSYNLMPCSLEEKKRSALEWFLNSGQELKALSELQQIQASLCYSLCEFVFSAILVSVEDCLLENVFSVHPICKMLIPGVCIKMFSFRFLLMTNYSGKDIIWSKHPDACPTCVSWIIITFHLPLLWQDPGVNVE